MISTERQLEEEPIERLHALKYEYRPEIRDRQALERNFREKSPTQLGIELKSLGFKPLRAIEQTVEYKNDPNNG